MALADSNPDYRLSKFGPSDDGKAPRKRRPMRPVRPVLCPVCGHPVFRHMGLEKCYPRALDAKLRVDREMQQG